MSKSNPLYHDFKPSPVMQAYLGLTMQLESNEEELFDDVSLDLLDKTLDEIEDLPGFEVPVNGRYLLKANRKIKNINDKAAVEITLEVMECLKKDNDADEDTVVGTKFSQLFFLTGEEDAVRISVGLLKQFCKPIGERVGEANMKIIVKDHIKDVLLAATVTRRKDSKNPEVFRARLSNLELMD
jgi:hypothetical protein